ncbi:hypothetical protein NQ318_001498 [Aromia moschata]|uniref:Cytosolic non-specific dipeptidase n=1 Tax=Aromia moschata TaxID=1265417 RepID=A0AAV8Y8V4_9CUCU|nr:hypothetical protein NQ318_001498 [Aromia moschata]
MHYVDSNREQFLQNLGEAVKFKTITTELKYRRDIRNMRKFLEEWFKRLGIRYECFNIGHYTIEGKEVKLPPIILGLLDRCPGKKTICVYLHADVPKPDASKWATDPWTLTTEDKRFYGAGVACGKGPLMSWLHIIEAFRNRNVDIPVNLKLVVEFMNHGQCTGLADFLAGRLEDFLGGIDNVLVSESEWLGEKYPCITHGTVGDKVFFTTKYLLKKSEGSKTDIKEDMKKLFDTICDEDGNIIIPGFHELVDEVTPDEEQIYENIKDFDPEEIRGSLPENQRGWNKMKLLMHFWRFPAIYVDDVQECICDKKDTSVIKRNFVLRIVPKQIIPTTEKCIRDHIAKTVKSLDIENKVTCDLTRAVRPWIEDFRSPAYMAATRATIQIYKECPNIIREDRPRETITILDRVLEKPVVLLPLYCKGCNAGEENENITARNYYEGIKLLAAYMFQVARSRGT